MNPFFKKTVAECAALENHTLVSFLNGFLWVLVIAALVSLKVAVIGEIGTAGFVSFVLFVSAALGFRLFSQKVSETFEFFIIATGVSCLAFLSSIFLSLYTDRWFQLFLLVLAFYCGASFIWLFRSRQLIWEYLGDHDEPALSLSTTLMLVASVFATVAGLFFFLSIQLDPGLLFDRRYGDSHAWVGFGATFFYATLSFFFLLRRAASRIDVLLFCLPIVAALAAAGWAMLGERYPDQKQYLTWLVASPEENIPRSVPDTSDISASAADIVERARMGNAEAMFQLGQAYIDDGEHLPGSWKSKWLKVVLVKEDSVKANQWLLLAAERNYVVAQYYLGLRYLNGDGVEKDEYAGAQWLLKSAEKGNADAQYAVGYLYVHGQGLTKNDAEGARWYRKAATQENVYAQTQLGQMYEKGEGVEDDLAQARQWYQKAADRGERNAQYYLGMMYLKGSGVAQNNLQAYCWLSLAGPRTDEDMAVLATLHRKLSKKQILEAEEFIISRHTRRPEG